MVNGIVSMVARNERSHNRIKVDSAYLCVGFLLKLIPHGKFSGPENLL